MTADIAREYSMILLPPIITTIRDPVRLQCIEELSFEAIEIPEGIEVYT
jgi:hypothetical protein